MTFCLLIAIVSCLHVTNGWYFSQKSVSSHLRSDSQKGLVFEKPLESGILKSNSIPDNLPVSADNIPAEYRQLASDHVESFSREEFPVLNYFDAAVRI